MTRKTSSGTLAGARAGSFFAGYSGQLESQHGMHLALSNTQPLPGRQYAQQRGFARGLMLLAVSALAIGTLILVKAGFFAALGWFLAAGGNALAGAAWWPQETDEVRKP